MWELPLEMHLYGPPCISMQRLQTQTTGSPLSKRLEHNRGLCNVITRDILTRRAASRPKLPQADPSAGVDQAKAIHPPGGKQQDQVGSW